MVIGPYLRQKRILAGYRTQEALSHSTYLAQGYISRVESSDTFPNDETLMIYAIALDLSYEEVFTQAQRFTDEYKSEILQQEVVDKKLFEITKSIIYKILKSDSNELQAKFLITIFGEAGYGVRSATNSRFEKSRNQFSIDLTNGHALKEDTYEYVSRCEATRMFYSLSRNYAKNYRALLLERLNEFNEDEKPDSEAVLKSIIELTDDSFVFSIHGKQLTPKEIHSLIEHHLTARRIDELFPSGE
ncbi:helix-turn-helix transcriptional regulator [Paenibacillus taichungensis]|uniref:Helix-turn-helix transcriptional regulator n=1 Tax=Paenibacillus taichungensis TaxID=484184 RepID=A0ABX2ML75_9BACL|nr:helix-turn-helix transcriptional regulator [Paenibacillus taichungensis]NUU54780.1 helix-turn-helix transcriptional regulator [Paenibacillus taichungensis]